ncbi:hypothetical protein Pla110_17800 [Polystyrenella longa]|uniref:VWFA domain-containing protein n=1 Tax=Polystyrenella longa TaxID=2528007 RepID=A0A518CLF4_9PLAN|nr:VWA domain-containing protein [Polystyrenella longa]QDU80058.1 hypothetical protein Pla110_17800 [Polystyrenella longa]
MSLLENFHFIRPLWLLLIPMAMGVWWLWQYRIDPLRGWREQVDPVLLKAMIVSGSERRDLSSHYLLAGWIVATVAVAGPTWRQDPSPFAADAAPLIILLKADKSMDQDGQSPTPLERGQLKIADLANIRKGQPLGLIAYAGSSHLVLPPTKDTSVVSEMASEISSDIMPEPGDRLDLAIAKAEEVLKGVEAGGTLLVIANSVEGDLKQIKSAQEKHGSFPIQFLALDENESIERAADALRATVVTLTPDDDDIMAISRAAERKSIVGIGGKEQRWQEAGYWLVPILAMALLLSFRREKRNSD